MPVHILHHKRRGVFDKIGKRNTKGQSGAISIVLLLWRRGKCSAYLVSVVKGLGEKNYEKDLFEKTALHSSTDHTE